MDEPVRGDDSRWGYKEEEAEHMRHHQPDDTLEDAAIVSLFCSGRPERQRAALAALFDRYGPTVYSLAFHIAGEKAIAENVTVEVFFRFWQNAMYWSTSKYWAYALLRLAYTLALATTPDQPDPPDGVDSAGTQPRTYSWLPQRVLDHLSHAKRRAIELAYFLGLTCEEIAAILSSTPSRVIQDLRGGIRNLHVAAFLPARRHNRGNANGASN